MYHYQKDYEKFYHHGLLYLSFTTVEEIEDPVGLAVQLGYAVLVSEEIYNFGELLE